MLTGLIANLSILTAVFFFFHQIRRRYVPAGRSERLRNRVILGVLHGIAAVLLMFFSVRLNDTTIVDLRQIMIIASASVGGLQASLITAGVAMAGRVFFFGGFSPSSGAAILSAFLLAAGSGLLMRHVRGSGPNGSAVCCSVPCSSSARLPICSVRTATARSR